MLILPSDVAIWLMFAALFAYVLRLRGQRAATASLRQQWYRVFCQTPAFVSAIVLAFFCIVVLADSIHFKTPNNDSLLDLVLGSGLSQTKEKTSSAPLASHSFVKENMVGKPAVSPAKSGSASPSSSSSVRDYPPLRIAGAQLPQGADQTVDKFFRILGGLFLAGFLTLFFVLASAPWQKKYHELSWRAAYISVFLLLLTVSVLAFLSTAWHPLGTDRVGQSVLYLALKSVRTAFLIALLTTLLTLPLALIFGLLAGWFGGWIDEVIQYLYTTISAVPGVLLIAAMVLLFQGLIDQNSGWFDTPLLRADTRLLILCFILAITGWIGLARLIRAEVIKLRELEYVQAAIVSGNSTLRLFSRHLLPNMLHLLIISAAMDVSALILSEAVLSYVGIGVDSSTLSFGNLVVAAQQELSRQPPVWWLLVSAFAFMFVLVLCANFFADAVRDAFNPRHHA